MIKQKFISIREDNVREELSQCTTTLASAQASSNLVQVNFLAPVSSSTFSSTIAKFPSISSTHYQLTLTIDKLLD